MTVGALLSLTRARDIRLSADGDRLAIDAPEGALTPDVRAELVRHKLALVAWLSPPRFVTLRPDARTGFAPTLPLDAIELALDLESRGCRQSLDAHGAYQITAPHAVELTDADRAGIARWRWHLAALFSYQAPAVHRVQ
jgi:hypothetical protein